MQLKEFMEQTGATYRQIDWWVRHGIINVSEAEFLGSGWRRDYLEDEVPITKALVEAGKFLGVIIAGKPSNLSPETVAFIRKGFKEDLNAVNIIEGGYTLRINLDEYRNQ